MTALEVSRRGPVGRIKLARPEARNAINEEMVSELPAALEQFAVDPTIRAVELSAEGPVFCAGGDLSQSEVFARGDDAIRSFVEQYHSLPRSLYQCPLPIVVGVDGAAVGAGCDLVLACDLVIATPRASFSELFVDVGLAPDAGGSTLLQRHIGLLRAKSMVLTGRRVGADEAQAIGIVHEVTEHLQATMGEWGDALAAKPTAAIRHAKSLLHEAWGRPYDDSLRAEAQAAVLLLRSDAFQDVLRTRD